MINKREFNQKLRHLTIIQAAKELFFEKRYSTITVDNIAERAGVTKRTLYKYFPSKLALFIHVFDEYLQKLYKELVKPLELNLPTEQLIEKIFYVIYVFTKENEKFMRLFWTLDSDEFLGPIPEELINRIQVWNRAMIDVTVKRIQAKKEGLCIQYDPELLVHLMSAINKGIFVHTNKENRFNIADINSDQLYAACIKLFNKGLFSISSEKSTDSNNQLPKQGEN